ncbi:MAG TPA: flagellar biosynthesis regulator FlaF [Magnetospirillum sp.]|nr:flagellar biosynthesis regulator FlaF [Magnetospirillum sp.]
MGSVSIPVRLTLPESSAVALTKAADDMADARDSEHFLAALHGNHRLWRTIGEISRAKGWTIPHQRIVDFVVNTTHKAGRSTGDDQIETLIAINRDIAAQLAEGQDIELVTRRAELAWRERGRPYGVKLDHWLIGEMERKARLRHVFSGYPA